MGQLKVRAYIRDKVLHVLYDVNEEKGTIHISGECGKELLDFVYMKSERIQAIVQALLQAYLQCVAQKVNTPNERYQILLSAVEVYQESNTYILGRLLESIYALSEEGIPEDIADIACQKIKDEKKKKLMKLYCIAECKELYLQQLPEILINQQKQLLSEMHLLWGEAAVWQELEPEQRLYLVLCSGSYPTRYLNSKSHFTTSIGTVNHYTKMQDEALCAALIKDMAGVFEMYEFQRLDDLMSFEMMQSVILESNVKQCENCGAWFVPEGRSDSIYCSHIAEGETKPCTIIGALRKRAELVKDEPVYQAYTAAVKRMSKRKCRKGGLTDKQYREWARAAERMRDQCLRGQVSTDKFDAWLDETSRLNQKRSPTCWEE